MALLKLCAIRSIRAVFPMPICLQAPRGIGKTTVARILAKGGLNCESGPTSAPCGECGECVTIAAGTSLNTIEIDGASNRGIDNVRELRGGRFSIHPSMRAIKST